MTIARVELLTGRLAEKALWRLVGQWGPIVEFEPVVIVLPINVVSLATVDWIGRHHTPGEGTIRIIIPGLCQGNLQTLREKWATRVERGPEDYRDLPEFFKFSANPPDLSRHSIQILAEINHAQTLSLKEIQSRAQILRSHGADMIDLGLDPGGPWLGVSDAVKALMDDGNRVSIDSFDSKEVKNAVAAGAELVLSVNHSNLEQAPDWGVEVVAIPDHPAEMATLWNTADILLSKGIALRLDPILEPIGHGFGASLLRYVETRQRFPNADMMMGIGNLTEMTQVDSSGVNFLLLALCQEWSINSILTTEVAGWCHNAVQECNRIRGVVFHSIKEGVVPKRLDEGLVVAGESKKRITEPGALDEIAGCLTDKNIRMFAENGSIEVMNGHFRFGGVDPFLLFEKIQEIETITPSHAFYLGYEMAKAVTALTLGKHYRQDSALNWGYLTNPEKNHLKNRSSREIL